MRGRLVVVTKLNPHSRPILQRFVQMLGLDGLFTRQIGDGTAQLEHTVIGPCREIHLAHGGAHEVLAT